MLTWLSKHSGRLFVMGVIAILLLPTLLQRGMFLDGVTYAAISSMLADGIGQYNAPFYTSYLGPVFYDQLPLGLIVESWFFDLLGQHYWVERLYCLVALTITLIGMHKVWGALTHSTLSSLWPIFLYMAIPIVFWSYREHTLEVGMAAACVWATYLGIISIQKASIISAICCGILTMIAVWAKGPTGAYPIAVPIIYLLSYRLPLQRIAIALIPTVVFLVTGMILLQIPVTETIISNYLDKQLMPALEGKREVTVSNRFAILIDLISEIAVPLALALIMWGVGRLRHAKAPVIKIDYRKLAFMLLVGLSASLPLIITLKQRRFYLLPALPFYAMAIAYWSYHVLTIAKTRVGKTGHTALAALGLCLLLTATVMVINNADGYARDQGLIEDVRAIDRAVPDGRVVSAEPTVCAKDWVIHAYLARYARISLQCDSVAEYHIVEVDGRLVLQ